MLSLTVGVIQLHSFVVWFTNKFHKMFSLLFLDSHYTNFTQRGSKDFLILIVKYLIHIPKHVLTVREVICYKNLGHPSINHMQIENPLILNQNCTFIRRLINPCTQWKERKQIKNKAIKWWRRNIASIASCVIKYASV